MHRIGDLYHIPTEYRYRHGQVMILLEKKNGKGKFLTQGSGREIWDHLNLVIKVNYKLPKYHGGDREYWNKLHDKLDKKFGNV